MLDHKRAAQVRDNPRLLPCADHAWSSMIPHVEQRSSRRKSRGWFSFLSRVVHVCNILCVELIRQQTQTCNSLVLVEVLECTLVKLNVPRQLQKIPATFAMFCRQKWERESEGGGREMEGGGGSRWRKVGMERKRGGQTERQWLRNGRDKLYWSQQH